jgi:hypothetical protein
MRVQSSTNLDKTPSDNTSKICRSHAYDAYEQSQITKREAGCKTISKTTSGATTTSDMECTVGKTVVRTKTTMTKTGEDSMRSETHGTYTPPMGGMSEITMIGEQKYLGACPAGMQPGDTIRADGSKANNWKH